MLNKLNRTEFYDTRKQVRIFYCSCRVRRLRGNGEDSHSQFCGVYLSLVEMYGVEVQDVSTGKERTDENQMC